MIVADLLISDKSSVSSCVSVFVLTLIDFTVLSFPWTSWLMSQLITRLADQDSGGRHMQEEVHVHVGEGLTTVTLGIGRCCVPWTWTHIIVPLLEEVKWAHQHYHILSYNHVILLGQPSYPLIQIGEIKLSIDDGDERSSMMWVDEFNIINNQLLSPRKKYSHLDITSKWEQEKVYSITIKLMRW